MSLDKVDEGAWITTEQDNASPAKPVKHSTTQITNDTAIFILRSDCQLWFQLNTILYEQKQITSLTATSIIFEWGQKTSSSKFKIHSSILNWLTPTYKVSYSSCTVKKTILSHWTCNESVKYAYGVTDLCWHDDDEYDEYN